MVKRYIVLFVAGILLLFVVAGFLLFQTQASPTPQSYLVPTGTSPTSYQPVYTGNTNSNTDRTEFPVVSQVVAQTPQAVSLAFYNWYISSPESPIATGSYKTNNYLSVQFKNQIASLSQNRNGYDPVLCDKNKSTNVKVGDPIYNSLGEQAKVVVSANVPNGKDLYRFVLNYSRGQWFISDIICIP